MDARLGATQWPDFASKVFGRRSAGPAFFLGRIRDGAVGQGDLTDEKPAAKNFATRFAR